MFVAILGNPVANDDHRIADRARDGQDFEISLGKIAKVVEVVHLVLNKKEGVFGIVRRRGRANDHAGCIGAVPGHAVGGACVTAQGAQVGDVELRFCAK